MKKKSIEETAIEAWQTVLADYTSYTAPIAIMNDEETGYLKIISAENAKPELEYRGDQHPFHKVKNWMTLLFPDSEDSLCPLCSSKFHSSVYMILHLKFKHAFDWYQCQQCSIWRNLPSEMVSHCKDVHNGVDTEHVCPCCKTSCSTEKLEEHCQSCFLMKYD